MPNNTLCVSLDAATDRQILLAILHRVTRLESAVADLSTAVQELQTSVANLSARITDQIDPLRQALADAQQALTDFQEADKAEDAAFQAAIDQLTADLGAAVAEGQAAADAIEATVSEVDNLVTRPNEEPDPEPEPEPEPPAEG